MLAVANHREDGYNPVVLINHGKATSMPKSTILTYDDVKRVLSYNPDTGVFTWLIDASRNVKAGSEAGCAKGARRNRRTGEMTRYVYIRLNNIDTPAARIAWLLHHGEWPRGNILFHDGDTTNFRITNLREAVFPQKVIMSGDKKIRKMSKEAQRHYGLKRYYGLTGEQYGQMLADQHGLCAVCNKPETAVFNGQPKVMHVDHDHATGKIRALLCGSCNGMLGLAKDNSVTLRAAADYIERHNANTDNVVPMKKGTV